MFTLPCMCASVSVAASIGLMRRLHQAGPSNRGLMGRQLWHLAAADCLCSLGIVLTFILQGFKGSSTAKEVMTGACDTEGTFCLIGALTSSLVEVHLSLSFLAGLCRNVLMLDLLRRSLLCLWPLGSLLGVWQLCTQRFQWTAQDGCKHTDATLFAAVQVLSLLVCGSAYLISLILVMCSGRVGYSVQSKVWTRAQYFLLVWLVCTCPNTVRLMRNWKFLDSMWCMSLALSLNALNGFANTVVYALLTNYVQRLEDRSPNLFSLNTVQDHRHSFRVAFGEQSVDEPVRTSWTPSTSDFNSCEDVQEEVLCCFEAT